MNRQPTINRLISAVLALLVLTGVTMPSGLHHKEGMMEMCESMKPVHNMNHDSCDFGFSCACSIGQAPVETPAKVSATPLLIKSNLSGFVFFNHQETPSKPKHPGQQHKIIHDSSPPIFLKNNSFLN